jgi:hypothetical protein
MFSGLSCKEVKYFVAVAATILNNVSNRRVFLSNRCLHILMKAASQELCVVFLDIGFDSCWKRIIPGSKIVVDT